MQTRPSPRHRWPALAALCLLGCAPDLRDKLETDTVDTVDTSDVTHTDLPADLLVIDATDSVAWVYFDLETRAVVTPALPEDTSEWDLAFRRFRIKVNGGVSGTGGVEAAELRGGDYETLTQAPAAGYLTDQPDDEDENEEPEYAFDGWFDYNSATHVVTAADVIYATRSVEGSYAKIKLLAYYDDVGTPGVLQLRLGEIAAP